MNIAIDLFKHIQSCRWLDPGRRRVDIHNEHVPGIESKMSGGKATERLQK